MKTYLVGGAIRDNLLGLKPKERDWVVVGSSPDEMKSRGFKQVGKAFPVFIDPESGEVFVNNTRFTVLNIDEGRYFKDQTYVVPDDELFVLGDNRINSQDSRYIGTIPYNNIVGKAYYVIFPFENFTNIND